MEVISARDYVSYIRLESVEDAKEFYSKSSIDLTDRAKEVHIHEIINGDCISLFFGKNYKTDKSDFYVVSAKLLLKYIEWGAVLSKVSDLEEPLQGEPSDEE